MRQWGYFLPLLLPSLLVAGVEAGGTWTWLPVLLVFGIVPLLDLIVPHDQMFLLEVVNYLEHYGLERTQGPDGRYQRVEVVHSRNASARFTNWFLFNLQRHSHHHVEHYRRYQVLRHMDESPQLPTGYAGMVLSALIPAAWMKIMNTRLEHWRVQRLGS